MKKLKRVFGSVANLASARDDSPIDPPIPVPLSSSRKSIAGSIHGLSEHRGSYVSYESQSLDSYNSSLSAEVDPYNTQDKTFSKLHKWAYLGDVLKLKKFIKKISVDAQDSEGKTALHHAAAQGRGDALLFLLGSKGNVEMKDNAGMTPFLRAIERCQIHIVQMLLQRRVEVHVKDHQGNSSVHIASKTGATDLLSLLLDSGGDCDSTNNLNRAPLHLACSENQQEAAEMLLRHGASINVADKEGVTPLMMAAKVGSAPLVESLLENGADVNPIDSSKWSAASYARFTNHNQLHHRLSSLMEKRAGGIGLFSDDLLNVSDEGSGQEEGAVGLNPHDEVSDAEGAVDSWSDTSEVNSIKEKPKVNLTKFLPSSDESADNLISSFHESVASLSGPPKPPRLGASLSSLNSEPVDEKQESFGNKGKENLIKQEDMSAKSDDSWRSSSEEEPQIKPFSLLNEKGDTFNEVSVSKEINDRRESFDKSSGSDAQPRIRKDHLADLGLDNIEFHSSEEEISFDEEDDMLPIEGGSKAVAVKCKNSHELLDIGPIKELSLVKEGGDHTDSRNLQSPLISSRSSIENRKDTKQGDTEHLWIPVSEENNKKTPLNSSPQKLSSRKSPKKHRYKESKSSVFDSDTEEEISSQRPLRKKSATPTKKRLESPTLYEYEVSDDDCSQGKNSQLLHDTKGLFDSPLKIQSSPREKTIVSEREKVKVSDALGKLSDSSGTLSSNSKLSIFTVGYEKSRTNTLSTVAGTLGREGTMQEVEEMWEANPSISPKRSSSNSSVQNSEEHSRSTQDGVNRPPSGSLKLETKTSDHQEGEVRLDEGKNSVVSDSCEFRDNDAAAHLLDDNDSQVASPQIYSPNLLSPRNKEVSKDYKVNRRSTSQENSASLEQVSGVNLNQVFGNNGESKQTGVDRVDGKDNMKSEILKGQSVVTAPLSRKGSRTGTALTSGFGSIIFSDEDSMSQDPLSVPQCMDEIDDGVSAASTETEESTHFNSGLKDSLLTPLSSLPDAADVGQLQDLVRELRLKLEKVCGRKSAIETRYSRLQQQERQTRLQNEQSEQDVQRLQLEICSLTSRIKQLEYMGQCEQDSAQLKDQSLEEFHQRCAQLEEQCCTLQKDALQQDQLVESLMVQLQTKERVNQSLTSKLEEVSSQTKYVSMKSCQTEDILAELHSERNPYDFVDACVQTEEEHYDIIPRNCQEDPKNTNMIVDVNQQECLNCSQVKKQENEMNDVSVQTVALKEITEQTSASIGTQVEKSLYLSMNTGVQCVPEKVMKMCQTENSLQSHHSQTDISSENCEVRQKMTVSEFGCQVIANKRVAAVQTEDVASEDLQLLSSRDVPQLNVSEVSSALEPTLQNFSQDVKMLITEVVESSHNSLQELVGKSFSSHLKDLKGSMEISLDQYSALQRETTELKFSEWNCRLEEILQNQNDSVKEICNSIAAAKKEDSHNVFLQINDSLGSKFNLMQQEIEEMQKTLGSSEGKVTSHLRNVLQDLQNSNDGVIKCIHAFHKEQTDANVESYDKLAQLTLPQLEGLQKAIQNLNQSEDSGLSEDQTRSIISRLDSLEKSVLSSFEKGNTSQDSSSIELEMQKMNDGIHKKLSVLLQSFQALDSYGKVDQEIFESCTSMLKDNNKQLLHVLKTKTSESTTNINETLEENFIILQDHLRKVQQSLSQRMNELAQHVHVAEDQKMSWISKQVTEMATQVSGMQTNFLRMQSSLEATQSLPPLGGTIDETLISSLRVTNDQALSSLKFQNQSVINLLESIQKELHTNAQKSHSSNDSDNQHLKELLSEKEEELSKLNSSQESFREKLREQTSKLELSRWQEEQLRMKMESHSEKLHLLERDLKERDEKLRQEHIKNTNQSEDSIKTRQDNFRLSSENNKLTSMLNAEQQQKQWYEKELQSQRDAKEIAETKVQEMIVQLQMSQQSVPLQRTPPTGRDNDEDNLLLKQKEIKRLEAENQKLKVQCSEKLETIQHLELQVKDIKAELGLEQSSKHDIEKQLKAAKDAVEILQKNLREAALEHDALQELQNSKIELEAAVKSDEIALNTLKKKLEFMNKENLKLKQNIMLQNGEKLSFDLVKQERDLAEEMQRKMEDQFQMLQKKISEDYVAKSRLNHLKKEMEHKYQMELSVKLSELNHLIEEQNHHQESQAKAKESNEEGLRREVSRLSEEVIRLKAHLSVHEEDKDSWRVRHDRLMSLYQEQIQTHRSKSSSSRKYSEDSLSANLREINAHLQTPLATSTLLGQLTPPSSLHLPKTPNNIDSYHYTHSDSLDRTLQKYLKAAESNHSRYLSSSDDKPHARISPMQPSHLQDSLSPLDKSCEAYVDLLNKKYGL